MARKEHDELSSNIDLIDVLPPGLYEAVFERKTADTAHPELAGGDWIMRCEVRTLDDIRALGGNDTADDRCFAAAARISETNLALYRAGVQPFVRAFAGAPMAEGLAKLHPLRLQYELLTDANPLAAPLSSMAAQVKEHRSPAATDNPFVALEKGLSDAIVTTLDSWRDACEAYSEKAFFAIFGSRALQAAAGIDPAKASTRRAPKSALHEELKRSRIAELKSEIAAGGLRAAVLRALLFAGMSRNAVDERSFECVRRIRSAQQDMPSLPLSAFKALVREQFLMLLIDQEASLAAIPSMLPPEPEIRRKAFELIKELLKARGELTETDKERLLRVARLFDVDSGLGSAGKLGMLPPVQGEPLGQGILTGIDTSGFGGAGMSLTDLEGIAAIGPLASPPQTKYERLIGEAKKVPAVRTLVAHPCDEASLRGATEAAEAGIIIPVLVGPAARIATVAREHGLDISRFEIVDVPHSEAAAGKAVALVREGKGELLMKGSLHTDELMREVTSGATGLRTARRISHVFIMDVPTYSETLFLTDAAINIFPDPGRQARHRAERDRPVHPNRSRSPARCVALGGRDRHRENPLDHRRGRVVQDGRPRPDHRRRTRWAAGLRQCDRPRGGKDQGDQIRGCGARADFLVVPDLEAGNMLAKNLTFLAKADAAGIVLGARVPIILTSRADSVRSRMASCAVAVLYAHARRSTAAAALSAA